MTSSRASYFSNQNSMMSICFYWQEKFILIGQQTRCHQKSLRIPGGDYRWYENTDRNFGLKKRPSNWNKSSVFFLSSSNFGRYFTYPINSLTLLRTDKVKQILWSATSLVKTPGVYPALMPLLFNNSWLMCSCLKWSKLQKNEWEFFQGSQEKFIGQYAFIEEGLKIRRKFVMEAPVAN